MRSGKDKIESVISYMKKLESIDTHTDNGECWGLVYRYDSCVDEIIDRVAKIYMQKNSVSSTTFPSISLIERELISICNKLMHGKRSNVGCVTSGATESNFLALKAYRDRAWHERGKNQYEVMLPQSAHPSFHKAAHDLDLITIDIPIQENIWAINISQFTELLSDKVIAVVLSAPSYIYGKIDPIEEISKIAEEYGIPVHVDAAIGGMFLPFMPKLKHLNKPYDFSISGVRSICIDLHKYGFAPKGASVLLYRDAADRRYQYFVKANYCGSNYASPVFLGSRSPVASACALAIYKYLKFDGFEAGVFRVLGVCGKIKKFLMNHPFLELLTESDMSIICIASKLKNMADIANFLLRKKWFVTYIAELNAIHLIVMPVCGELLKINKKIATRPITHLSELIFSKHFKQIIQSHCV